MKKQLLLLLTLCLSVGVRAQTVVLSQDFNGSANVNDYFNINAPNLGQFNSYITGRIFANNPNIPPTIGIENGKLKLGRPENAVAVSLTRSTNFSVVPQIAKVEMKLNMTDIATLANASANLEIGHNFDHNATAGSLNSTSVHSNLVIWVSKENDNSIFGFSAGGIKSTQSYSGEQKITWVINSSVNSFVYEAPDGSSESVGSGKWDLWVGNTKLWDDANRRNASPLLKNMRISFSSGNGNMIIDDIKITSLLDTPLPISLTSFTGKSQQHTVQLNWTTAAEQNNKHFILSRSQDGRQFEEIAQVDGAGNSIGVKSYQYVDKNPLPCLSYYRLQQEDFNGDKQLPQVITMNSGIPRTQLSIVNQPTGLVVNVFSLRKTNAILALYNTLGQQLYRTEKAIGFSNNQFVLPPLMASGVYVLHYTAKGEKAIAQKISIK